MLLDGPFNLTPGSVTNGLWFFRVSNAAGRLIYGPPALRTPRVSARRPVYPESPVPGLHFYRRQNNVGEMILAGLGILRNYSVDC